MSLHIGFAVILLIIATVCYWAGQFVSNKGTQAKLFTTGRWVLTIAAIIAVISLLLAFFAIFAIMSGHASSHESIGYHGWHGASIFLIIIMAIWAWVIHLAKKEMNFIFLIGLLVTLAFAIFGHGTAYQHGMRAAVEQPATVTTTTTQTTPTATESRGVIEIQAPASYKPHESRDQ